MWEQIQDTYEFLLNNRNKYNFVLIYCVSMRQLSLLVIVLQHNTFHKKWLTNVYKNVIIKSGGIMKKVKKIVFVSLFALITVTTFSNIGVAHAATQYPSAGGKWVYDSTLTKVYSNYLHDTRTHFGQVKNTKTSAVTFVTAKPQYSANASQTQVSGDQIASYGF